MVTGDHLEMTPKGLQPHQAQEMALPASPAIASQQRSGFQSIALSHTPAWSEQAGSRDREKSDNHSQEETLRHEEPTVQILYYLLNKEIKNIKTEPICIKSKSLSSA